MNRFARWIAFLLALAGTGGVAAQNQYTNITAPAGSLSINGHPLNGTLTAVAVTPQGVSLPEHVANGGLVVPGQNHGYAIACTISAGGITGGCPVPDACTANGAIGTLYTLNLRDTFSGLAIPIPEVPSICGASWPLNAYTPTLAATVPLASSFISQCGPPSGTGPALGLYFDTCANILYVDQGGAYVPTVAAFRLASGSTNTTAENQANKGAASGYAPLDGNAKLPLANLPQVLTTSLGSVETAQLGDGNGNLLAGPPVREFTRPDSSWNFSWLKAFYACNSQAVEITSLGDSRTVAFQTDGANTGPTTFHQVYPQAFFENLLNAGCPWHGTGWVPFLKFLGGGPNPNGLYYQNLQGSFSLDRTFGPAQLDTSGSIDTQTQIVPAGGYFEFITAAVGRSVDTMQTMCLSGPGLAAETVTVMTAARSVLASYTCGGPAASLQAVVATSSTFTAQSVIVAHLCPSGGGSCEFYADRGTLGTVGVELNNIGVASAVAELYTTPTAFAYVDQMLPANLLLVDYGTNETVLNHSPASYASALNTIVTHFQAQSSHPSVLLTFPPMSNGFSSYPELQTYSTAARGVAAARGTGWNDISDRWGAGEPANCFVDGVHPNSSCSLDESNLITAASMDLPFFALRPTSVSLGGAGVPSSTVTNGPGVTGSFVSGMPFKDSRFTVQAVVASALGQNAPLLKVSFGEVWMPNCVATPKLVGVGGDSGLAIGVQVAVGTDNSMSLVGLPTGVSVGTYQWNVSCGN